MYIYICNLHLLSVVCVPLVPGNSFRNAYRNRRVPLIPVPFPFRSVPRGGYRSTPFVSKSRFFSHQNSKLDVFSPTRVRGMSDDLVNKTVVPRMNKNFISS